MNILTCQDATYQLNRIHENIIGFGEKNQVGLGLKSQRIPTVVRTVQGSKLEKLRDGKKDQMNGIFIKTK